MSLAIRCYRARPNCILSLYTTTHPPPGSPHPIRLGSVSTKPARSFTRMSSSAPTKEWLVHVPDFPGALDKRLAARPTHLGNLKPAIEAGKVVFGGATLSKQPAEGEAPDMTGSAMLIKADSEEEVRKILEEDPYTKGGAWDVKNAKIWPFKCAVRTAL
ncbi:hypothetical protein PV05_08435 [Exophiala xenobiotica]|uniref:YCII-related domain-containing protein n=1 Tax=Exophiala xenobiotica TaxID=348802 RepID=A0A0D2CS16_9EURO|nr:uncharacterized protein PV05_08435 [Exophiala xenobiotica]KIW52817.1 hypothetical protein PV05_08435 [Exophiala xenobiotica]